MDPSTTGDMSAASRAGPKLPSSEPVARVLQPDIVGRICEFGHNHYDKDELRRLLKVCKVFYQEAIKILYRSLGVYVKDDQLCIMDKPLTAVRVDDSKKHLLAYMRHIEMDCHKKVACAALRLSPDSNANVKPEVLFPHLKSFHFYLDEGYDFKEGEDCNLEDCPATRGLQTTNYVGFTICLANPKDKGATIKKFKAAVTRLSKLATSVYSDFGNGGPAVLDRFITAPLGPRVTKLTFTFNIAGECSESPVFRAAFTRSCKFLAASLQQHEMDEVTSITFEIFQNTPQCCWECQDKSARTFEDEAALYKRIWERMSRHLPHSHQARVSFEWWTN